MYAHHQQSLDKLAALLSPDPELIAIITAGSIAHGTAKETSDVDVYLVYTEDEFAKRQEQHQTFYYNIEICDYPGGYIDGKIISWPFLELAAEQGSEPTRYSFRGSQVVYSRKAGLERLLEKIAAYPEQNRDANLRDFYAQLYLYGFYFAREGEWKQNPYLLAHSTSSLVLYGGRAILAYNRMLFPCHKDLMDAVKAAPDKPEHFISQANDLIAEPTYDKCKAFTEMMLAFHNPGITYDQAVSLFVTNNEWNWMQHEPPLADR